MATDSSGWNTSSAFQKQTYDPTALANGLQSAATYDPTNQASSSPASMARFLGGTQSNAAPATDVNPQQSTASQAPNAGTMGLTTASNNTLNSGYSSKLAVAGSTTGVTGPNIASSAQGTWTDSSGVIHFNPGPSTSVPVVSSGASLQAPNANQAAATQATTNARTPYGGPNIIAAHITGEVYSYYQFNQNTGQYEYRGTYSGKDQASNPFATSQAQVVGYNDRVHDADLGASYITSTQQPALDAWNKQNQIASAGATASAATAAGTQAYQQALDYMTTHNGQLDPSTAAIMNNTFSGNAASQIAQQDAIKKAQTDYAAQQAHSQVLGGIAIKPIDTSAVDATGQAAINSLISQYASQGGGGGAQLGAFNAGSISGQNVLSHDTAAATSYNSNLTNFANALTAQKGADTSATGNQLYSDIQGIQQIAAQIQQQIGQLSTTKQQQAQAQIDQLNNAVNAYQQAVANYGQGSTQAMQLATGIFSTAASVASAGVA